MSASIQTSDIIKIYCETSSFRSLSEQYRELLSTASAVDVVIYFRFEDGCFVSCGREGCHYYSKELSPPEGYSLAHEVTSEECSTAFYTASLMPEGFPLAATLMAQLLIKRIQEDDARLKASEDSVVSVVGITYHDMRNILGSISGIVQLIELDISEEDELMSSIREISSVVDRFELSSRNTMKLYRNEPIHYSASSVDITALYQKLLEKRKRVFSLSDITLSATVDDDLTGSLSEEYVSLFLNELLSNAFDSFEELGAGGNIFVEVKRDGDACKVVVEDEGGGIPYDLQRHIYKLFVTTKNKRRGTGLSIIARTLGDWGGMVQFQSTPGKGSRFEVVFPFVL